ncbi:MAG: hypothetical protein NTW74_24400 [Acidobacteria bacterium]|nr:hypothetical protein [Acidobacteriota bacterium]
MNVVVQILLTELASNQESDAPAKSRVEFLDSLRLLHRYSSDK